MVHTTDPLWANRMGNWAMAKWIQPPHPRPTGPFTLCLCRCCWICWRSQLYCRCCRPFWSDIDWTIAADSTISWPRKLNTSKSWSAHRTNTVRCFLAAYSGRCSVSCNSSSAQSWAACRTIMAENRYCCWVWWVQRYFHCRVHSNAIRSFIK